ncbi:hypothetical protein RFM41_12095 [Mesorhizobium sp. VK25A]|uniref:Uncharacterized protein n=1 Tax=Mesorhizobium vachelliae TaxID=3072309 RepID=A0ABU4ZXG2_9HYPH|nr:MULTISPECIES: hypothetical protein [unclassified Mesorhizobium]MDX8530084.1 hypothetical protein [Mesorhizobium sp. VK25D]MDX8544482.1 hypothetical protein [Mesorhizobium sp. VK25A]
MTITINTDFYPSQDEANDACDAALGCLSDCLTSVPYLQGDDSPRLYPRKQAKAA